MELNSQITNAVLETRMEFDRRRPSSRSNLPEQAWDMQVDMRFSCSHLANWTRYCRFAAAPTGDTQYNLRACRRNLRSVLLSNQTPHSLPTVDSEVALLLLECDMLLLLLSMYCTTNGICIP
ncbi:predicted protein [Histoplasma capsulatum H143]|uniref:Uncharacterized protein n=1 Tax=Ajellomyces capsulatus (strain H143) TaxID=544712 RepID=C6H3I3_AJECH|nr:predicted protein [Histoplasma capsulatum H143]